MTESRRDSVYLEDAEILDHRSYPGAQYILGLHAPKCAARAEPGSFAHVQCDPALPMRRPFSLMRADSKTGRIEILYKVLGEGTRSLARREPAERISVLAPLGRPFAARPERSRPLLLGGGVGIPPVVFLAERLSEREGYRPLALLGSEVPFPFETRSSQVELAGIPGAVTAAMASMEDRAVTSRLASLQRFDGCFTGYVTELARAWLDALSEVQLAEVEVFACGPPAMLAASARLARAYGLPCQVSLEEYMACAIGGCAGCTVEVRTARGPAMKRVCVDGPVFDAETVLFAD